MASTDEKIFNGQDLETYSTLIKQSIENVENQIPTQTSQLINNSNFPVDANYVHTDNNYTTAEKNKLAGIASGAEVNVQSDWNQTTTTADDYIKNKPTNVSSFNNDAGYLTEHQDISGKQDVLTAGDGIAIDNSDTIRTVGIPYGKVDSTSTSTVFTATVPGIDRLEDGVCVLLKNGVVTSAKNFTININGLGAKHCYTNMAAATMESTIFNVNYTMLFVYDSTRVTGGGWICYRGYDSDTNTNTVGYLLRGNNSTMKTTDASRYYKIFFTSADGTHWVPASVNSTNNATSARPVNQRPIDPFGRIMYTSANTNYPAGSIIAVATLWSQYPLSLGYSFNRTGAELTLTASTPVYVKCTPQTDGSAIIDADVPYVQALPTTNDGKIYIFLGMAYNATSIELLNNHPVYYHDGTGIRLWTGSTGGGGDLSNYYTKTEVDTALSGKQATLVSGTNIKTFNSVSLLGSGNITKPTYNGGEINYTGTTGNVVTNNTTLNVALKAIDDAIGNVETLLASI